MLVLTFILTSLILKISAQNQCGTCGTVSNVACISEDQYYTCVGGVPNLTQIHLCATGVCSDVPEICNTVSTTLPSCVACGVCNAPIGIACLSQTTYAGCIGNVRIGEIVCPTGQICHTLGNILNPCTTLTSSQTIRCRSVTTTTPEPTTTSTTPGFITSPQSFCRNQIPGFYKNPNDSYCRTYIYCFRRGGMRGMLMTCNGNYIFNPTTRSCVLPGTFVCPV